MKDKKIGLDHAPFTLEQEERIRQIISEEIVSKLNIDIRSVGFESTGIIIKVEFDNNQLAYEEL